MIYSRHSKGYAKKHAPKQQELDLQEVDSGRKSKRGTAETNTTPVGIAKRKPKKKSSDES